MSAGDGGAPAGPPAWAKPGPAGALTLAAFFDGVREGRLVVQRCLTCRALAVPPKAVCQECEAISWEPAPLGDLLPGTRSWLSRHVAIGQSNPVSRSVRNTGRRSRRAAT